MVSEAPFCAETPLEAQTGLITPAALFYVRNNFPVPSGWPGLVVEGARVGLGDLAGLPRVKLAATLECAGNGRVLLEPSVPGEPWGIGAVSTAEWSGTPLRELLSRLRLHQPCVEILFEGADGFARSLPREVALHPDTLLVTAMNDEPLPAAHGGPLRLLVPGWYAMASVKWLARISLLDKPFRGHFQVERYVVDGVPVQRMEVRSVITEPVAGSALGGPVRVAGYAWTGRGRIRGVEISDDRGQSWAATRLLDAAPPYVWTRWETSWTPREVGPATLLARARDSAGRVQPLGQRWNALGYANNVAAPHELTVAG